ncbi:hypothetical protein [Candidatus Methylomirabilis sp.]|uniref:hypothetical protein n=1 Tax=Candidatus Methylomirabilis sp. TaxID=2032687 RepID=UPI003C70D0B3
MTWRVLTADEIALFEEREVTPCFVDDDEPERVILSRSICGVPVATSVGGLEYSLSVLHVFGFHSAVREVLAQIAQTWSNHQCLADYYAGYGMLCELAQLLERSAPACEYVLALADVSDEKKNGYIRQARDLARSALAKHYANDAIEEMTAS